MHQHSVLPASCAILDTNASKHAVTIIPLTVNKSIDECVYCLQHCQWLPHELSKEAGMIIIIYFTKKAAHIQNTKAANAVTYHSLEAVHCCCSITLCCVHFLIISMLLCFAWNLELFPVMRYACLKYPVL